MNQNYYLYAIILKDCPYSIAAYELLNSYNIEKKIIFINYNDKEKYKNKDISTFPQIYLKKKKSNSSLLIGGYSQLKNVFDNFYKSTYSQEKINNFINDEHKNWNKKSTLRLIELINN